MNVISVTGLAIVILISLLVCYILLRIVKAKRLKSRLRDIHGKPIPESKNTSFEGVQDSDGLTTFSFFGSENIKVNTRELVREVMSTKSDKLLRWVWFVPKGSLFPSEGDDEKRHRKIVSTSMKKDHVQTMKSMVDDSSKSVVEILKKQHTIDDIYKFTLKQISYCVGLLTYGSLAPKAILQPVGDSIQFGLLSAIPMFRFIPFFGFQKVHKDITNRNELLKKHLEMVKERVLQGELEDDHALLTRMVRANIANDNLLTDKELLSNAFGIGVGGNDSTSSTCVSILFELANNPDKQNILRKEIEDNYSNGNLSSLPYLNAVINETLRLYPAFSIGLQRFSEIELTINGVTVPSGIGVIPSLVASNRNKTEFGEDADEWKPERYLDKSTPPHVTFGLGPRSCIGKNLALTILRQYTVDIVSNFQISRTDSKNIKIVPGGASIRVTHPNEPLSLKFTPI